MPEIVEALNCVIREGKCLFMDNEITDMEEELIWFERDIIAEMLCSVAGVDGKVVGGGSIHPHTDKRSHVAEFSIFVRNGYRNLRLGTVIVKMFIEVARKRSLEVLQLPIYATNSRAFHVYKNAGIKSGAS